MTDSPTARLIAEAINTSGKTQREIANKLGLRDAKSVENLLGHQLRQLRNRKRTS